MNIVKLKTWLHENRFRLQAGIVAIVASIITFFIVRPGSESIIWPLMSGIGTLVTLAALWRVFQYTCTPHKIKTVTGVIFYLTGTIIMAVGAASSLPLYDRHEYREGILIKAIGFIVIFYISLKGIYIINYNQFKKDIE